MSAIKDYDDIPPRSDLSSAAAHPFSMLKTANQFAAIRERLTEVAAELRRSAFEGAQPDDNLLNLARKLEAMATEDNPT
ncbi:MAG: hypothetical protein WCA78_06125 [Rhizomicrobium sp.]|jgi:hypothetical protein